jgi:hypothetical protein
LGQIYTYRNGVKQDKWVVSVNFTNLPGAFLLRFFELDLTLMLLSRNFTSKRIAKDIDTFTTQRTDCDIVECCVNIAFPVYANWAVLVPTVWEVWTRRPDVKLR